MSVAFFPSVNMICILFFTKKGFKKRLFYDAAYNLTMPYVHNLLVVNVFLLVVNEGADDKG